ncbi:MAG: sigma-70 family RNA polymerase sigma factor [Oscillospiraceae bacterium]|nr:sigma-70 family RNA polymerase sigma factor [Oscillospiraceae bacterium]
MTNETPPVASSSLSVDQLYDLYATDILRFAYYYLGDRQKAEDVTQDVFVKLITSHPVLSPGHEKAWLLKVALNRCRDYWRSSWVRRVVLGHPGFELFPSPDAIEHISDQVALAEAVNHLPAEFKEVVLLFYYQNFSVTEIAELLSVAEGTVSSRLNRARNRIRKHLEEGKQI